MSRVAGLLCAWIAVAGVGCLRDEIRTLCRANADCGSGEQCNLTTGFCLPLPPDPRPVQVEGEHAVGTFDCPVVDGAEYQGRFDELRFGGGVSNVSAHLYAGGVLRGALPLQKGCLAVVFPGIVDLAFGDLERGTFVLDLLLPALASGEHRFPLPGRPLSVLNLVTDVTRDGEARRLTASWQRWVSGGVLHLNAPPAPRPGDRVRGTLALRLHSFPGGRSFGTACELPAACNKECRTIDLVSSDCAAGQLCLPLSDTPSTAGVCSLLCRYYDTTPVAFTAAQCQEYDPFASCVPHPAWGSPLCLQECTATGSCVGTGQSCDAALVPMRSVCAGPRPQPPPDAGAPVAGLGRPCSGTMPCDAGGTCVQLGGAEASFCTTPCRTAGDCRLDGAGVGACALDADGDALPDLCWILCGPGDACPAGLRCDAASGERVCLPPRTHDGGPGAGLPDAAGRP